MACVVYGCKSHSSKKGARERPLAFHRFPEDEKMRELWIRAIRRNNWLPTVHSRICSDHFEEECYAKGKRKRLLCRDAVPTLFENHPPQPQTETPFLDTQNLLDSQNDILQRYREWTFNQSSVSSLVCEPDLDYIDDSPRNKLLVESLLKEKRKSARRLKKLKTMQQKCRRMIGKIVCLENIVRELQSKALIHREKCKMEENGIIFYVNT